MHLCEFLLAQSLKFRFVLNSDSCCRPEADLERLLARMCHHQMHMQEAPKNCQPLIDVNIVRQLIDLRFPQWAGPSLSLDLYEYKLSPDLF